MNISQILTKLKSLVYSKSEADTLLSSEVNGTVSASSMVVTNNSSNGVVFGSYRVYVG